MGHHSSIQERMRRMCVFSRLSRELKRVCEKHGLLDNEVAVRARALSAAEAIGNPEGGEFPLQKGKESLMQAQFLTGRGQAFTDTFGDFGGSLRQVVDLDCDDNYCRAVFTATLNAVLNHLGLVSGTVHCRDDGPAECGEDICNFLQQRFPGSSRILQIGFQPGMVDAIQMAGRLRVLDRDEERIGTYRGSVRIEGPEAESEALEWADVLLVTGTTLVNNTLSRYLDRENLYFYGTTIAGAAYLMGWKRLCPRSE